MVYRKVRACQLLCVYNINEYALLGDLVVAVTFSWAEKVHILNVGLLFVIDSP